jgi:uncharacterized protein YndB with AHSA1/START domain
MGHDYRDEDETVIDASPDEVWEAIATGPGMNAWFMGHTTVTGGEGGGIHVDMGGFSQDFTITDWRPGKRLAYTADPRPDGSFLALEWLIEGRSGTTVLRSVGSGFIGSNDWQDEYDSLRQGGRRYLHNVGQYLRFFRGRRATPVNAGRPQAGSREEVMRALTHGLGLTGLPAVGDTVRLAPWGLPDISGVVDYSQPHALGIRSDDALYRLFHGMGDSAIAEHHVFVPGSHRETLRLRWQNWLAEQFR